MPTIGPLKLKVQILCGDVPAMGPGKADLLEAIDRAGSISAAGRDLGMSYRRAWMLVDEMNRCWSGRLVEARSGGGELSGARLTAQGRDVLAAYRTVEAALVRAARSEALDRLQAGLRSDPVPRSGAA
ncbi:LysR family transcriptional regulator [Phenylobacterium sp.]|uniref:winged helix-turn-helix domain-containing protein n=1 Tax=Phenylobacterium sp. TaxID=1871053 RepID=UPI00301CCDDE